MTTVIKHSLRAGVSASGGYPTTGWLPTLDLTLVGPVPAGAVLVWAVGPPGGGTWLESRVEVPELAAGEAAVVRLRCDPSTSSSALPLPSPLTVAGTVSFLLRIVSELEGVDEVLHDGKFEVVRRGEAPAAGVFSVDNTWLHARAELGLDTVDEPDAPRLTMLVSLAGSVDAYAVSAHLFFEGARIAPASVVSAERAFTGHDGSVVGQEVLLVFDAVRGWNNLAASGWGGEWHLLAAHDGVYEVKVLLGTQVVGSVPFAVAGGRVVVPGAESGLGSGSESVEVEPRSGAVILVPYISSGAASGSPSPATPVYYGDQRSAAHWSTLDEMYAAMAVEDAGGVESIDADPQAVQAFVDRAERLLLTWEAELVGARPPFEYAQTVSAEAVDREEADYSRLRDAVAAVPDEREALIGGESTTLGGLRTRVATLFASARALIAGASAAHDDALAPYRALLAGDKLAVFDEHPVPAFVYTTTDRHVIETPEELAAADCWFFEGPLDLASTAQVDGASVRVTTQGWRVLGWRFAPDGTTLEEFETQGPGPSAPKTAFRAPA